MSLITPILSIILSIFSTVVMSYITMATPIGPWIASTLVLIAMLVYRCIGQKKDFSEQIALVTCAGSIGGILATGLGFSFPTLYFLDPTVFNSWMKSPLYFCAVVTTLSLAAGWFGLWIANVVEQKFIVEEQFAFPIGQLVNKMISAQNQVRKSWELLVGFVGTGIFCFLQDGLFKFKGFIPKSIALINKISFSLGSIPFTIPAMPFNIFPMLWAIGFVTGHVIAIPLAVGVLARIVVVEPINQLFFASIKDAEFVLAFCSGMVLAGAVQGLLDTPGSLIKALKKMMGRTSKQTFLSSAFSRATRHHLLEGAFLLVFLAAFLTYFKFSAAAQIYLIAFTFVCAYQIALIGGKLGLAPLGRFATFVMVPALFLFNYNSVNVVLIATFVEICGGVATDVLTGRKIAQLSSINRSVMKRFQYLGLIVSSLVVGAIFWFLINHFGLGSTELLANRSQTRALLVGAAAFDYYVLVVGFLFGLLLKVIKIAPMLVLGGLLMPLNFSIGLIIGGLATLLVKDKEEWYPFWSGVFASNSVWMLIKAIF